MTKLGEYTAFIIESYINGQRKQMIAQYKEACSYFHKDDVLLMLQLSEAVTDQHLIDILTTFLKAE